MKEIDISNLNLFADGVLLIKRIEENTRRVYYIDAVLNKTAQSKIGKITRQCTCCNQWFKISSGITYAYSARETLSRMCQTCRATGENNTFYGKKHSADTCNKISKANKGQRTGESNPFYGKTHTNEIREYLSEINKGQRTGESNPFYGKRHSDELMQYIVKKTAETVSKRTETEWEAIKEKLSLSQQKMKLADPDHYRELKRRGGLAAASKPEKYIINRLEEQVQSLLHTLGIGEHFKYSYIIDCKQYDFVSEKHKILLEVHGDYWHGNPALYTNDGKNGTRLLNEVQLTRIALDQIKYDLAVEHGFKYFYIFESDITSGKYDVLYQIKDLINEASKN